MRRKQYEPKRQYMHAIDGRIMPCRLLFVYFLNYPTKTAKTKTESEASVYV